MTALCRRHAAFVITELSTKERPLSSESMESSLWSAAWAVAVLGRLLGHGGNLPQAQFPFWAIEAVWSIVGALQSPFPFQ